MPWKSILEGHPEHVRLIGLIAVETGNLELALADLFARMLMIPLRIGRAVYLTPQSSAARLHILKNAARAEFERPMRAKTLRDRYASALKRVIEIHDRASKAINRRHRVVHDSWGFNDDEMEVSRLMIDGQPDRESANAPLNELKDQLKSLRKLIDDAGAHTSERGSTTDPRYLEELRKYGSGDPTEADVEALEAELYNGPDRGAAIVLGSLVERALERLLRQHMREDGVSGLFRYPAPLSDFGSKIQIGYALKFFGRDTRKDMNIIRSLRNQFAHSRMPIEFTTPAVRACCDELSYPDALGVHLSFKMLNTVSDERLAQASDKGHPRTRYFTACNEITQRIYFIRGGNDQLPINQLL